MGRTQIMINMMDSKADPPSHYKCTRTNEVLTQSQFNERLSECRITNGQLIRAFNDLDKLHSLLADLNVIMIMY